MSCDWNLYCKTCDSTHEFVDANHCKDLMTVLIRHASAIAGLQALIEDNNTWVNFELHTFYGNIDIEWFAEHYSHELVPRDEYGRINGID